MKMSYGQIDLKIGLLNNYNEYLDIIGYLS